jgi:hypothetical protein
MNVVGGICVAEEGTGVVYHRLTDARGVADACIAASNDAGGCRSVRSLTGVAEDTSLAVAGSVDVLVARLWVRLHRSSRCLVIAEVIEALAIVVLFEGGNGLGSN